MTYMQAALTILAHAERPLTIPEITAVAIADGLVRPRGRTPDRTMASVLYRRMAGDPDAPVISRGGRFWLRGRPVPSAETAYLAARSRRTHPGSRHERSVERPAVPGHAAARRATILPPPPLRLPTALPAATTPASDALPYAPLRRDRAVARAGERGAAVLARLAARRLAGARWDVPGTDSRLVRPVLSHLGYRAGLAAARPEALGREGLAYTLRAGASGLAVHVRRLAHDLDEDDAWRALGYALEADVPYAAITNGRELRLYAVAIAEAQDSAAAALVLVLDLAPTPPTTTSATAQAATLWLLRREAMAGGALDAYVAGRAVGAALLDALDAPDSLLARVLVADVRARSGLDLTDDLVRRHARLALRGRRGRDGEPAVEDVAAVAAVRDTSTGLPAAQSA